MGDSIFMLLTPPDRCLSCDGVGILDALEVLGGGAIYVSGEAIIEVLAKAQRESLISTSCRHTDISPRKLFSTSEILFMVSWSCIMLLSCLKNVSGPTTVSSSEHTLVEEHLCTGSQSRSLCRTGTATLRRTSACALDSGYKLE
jgi:hypothetical protein